MNEVRDNPVEVITTLDRELDHEVSLVVFGRGALRLGFERPLAIHQTTEDVDGIIRLNQLESLVDDESFWDAVDRTNKALEPKGLYITHLFHEDQVFLRPDWELFIVPVLRPPTRWLKLYRPHSIDLILTKMMRGDDAQDMGRPGTPRRVSARTTSGEGDFAGKLCLTRPAAVHASL